MEVLDHHEVALQAIHLGVDDAGVIGTHGEPPHGGTRNGSHDSGCAGVWITEEEKGLMRANWGKQELADLNGGRLRFNSPARLSREFSR